MKNNVTVTVARAANNSLIPQHRLLLVSFVEGCCVMVAELAGGKMLAPFYGTSLYVWASTLALTLGGLTVGYYIGGELSKKDHLHRQKALFTVLCAASTLVMIMPLVANFMMQQTMDLSFLTGLITSQFIFLLPPIMGMGMVSPLLISMIAENNASGKAAGLVYAISTLGGVIATLLTGFWLVPVVGISLPCIVIGALLLVLTLAILRPGKKMTASALLLLLIPCFFFYNSRGQQNTDKYKVLYHSEGILGQVKIIDFNYTATKVNMDTRVMMVNHNWQTWVNKKDLDFNLLYYTRFTNAVISTLPKGSCALLIGLGGGTVARQFEHHGIQYDAVEIDARLPKLAEEYFGLQQAVAHTAIDDGRHYINVSRKKYDLVIIDALLGDNIPSHLLSKECFVKIKSLLAPGGKIFIEFDGITEQEDGTGQKLLYNTLIAAGYKCRVFSSVPQRIDYDFMYIASPIADNSYDNVVIPTDNYFPISGVMKDFEMTHYLLGADGNPATDIITDNNPVLDFYLKDRVVAFRQDFLRKYNTEFMADRMSFFK